MKKYIIVTLQVEGLHYWLNAPEPVEYLASPHRHVFYITCKKEVQHNNRDIEIIQFQREVEDDILCRFFETKHKMVNFGMMSCEDIAEMLIIKHGLTSCTVLEDNENGAEIEA